MMAESIKLVDNKDWTSEQLLLVLHIANVSHIGIFFILIDLNKKIQPGSTCKSKKSIRDK